MNCRLDNVTITGKDGKLSVLEQVNLYIYIHKKGLFKRRIDQICYCTRHV